MWESADETRTTDDPNTYTDIFFVRKERSFIIMLNFGPGFFFLKSESEVCSKTAAFKCHLLSLVFDIFFPYLTFPVLHFLNVHVCPEHCVPDFYKSLHLICVCVCACGRHELGLTLIL